MGAARASWRCTSAYVGLVASARAPKPRQIACTRVVLPDPSSPENPMTAGGARPRPSASPNRLRSSARRRMLHRISLGFELEQLVAQYGRELEVQLFGGGLHLLLEHADQRFPLPSVRGARQRRAGRLGGLRVRHPRGETD